MTTIMKESVQHCAHDRNYDHDRITMTTPTTATERDDDRHVTIPEMSTIVITSTMTVATALETAIAIPTTTATQQRR